MTGTRGVNLANALEAPREGDWGVVLREEYFDAVKAGGFNMVRIPVALAAHADEAAPFALSEAIKARLEEILGWAAERRLTVILAFHSYEDLYQNPDTHGERFVGIWEQVAKQYVSRYPDLLFGLLNEPHGNLTAAIWNSLMAKAVKRIGDIDPERTLVLGGVAYSDVGSLEALVFPDGANNLIAAFHYYRPYHFTHQGADWTGGMDKWLGTEWSGDAEEIEVLKKDFAEAAAWSRKTGKQVFLEEFGCFAKAPPASRARWIAAVRREAEARGFGWAYWDFCAGFGVYNRETSSYDPPVLEALLQEQ